MSDCPPQLTMADAPSKQAAKTKLTPTAPRNDLVDTIRKLSAAALSNLARQEEHARSSVCRVTLVHRHIHAYGGFVSEDERLLWPLDHDGPGAGG